MEKVGAAGWQAWLIMIQQKRRSSDKYKNHRKTIKNYRELPFAAAMQRWLSELSAPSKPFMNQNQARSTAPERERHYLDALKQRKLRA